MSLLFEFPLFTLFVAGLFIALIVMATRRRGPSAKAELCRCGNCGQGNPASARYCRRCGHRM